MTLQQFIEFCKTCDDTDEIYETYYKDQALTDAIYDEGERLGVVFGDDIPEPMRASLEAIGIHYGVAVLENW